MANLRNWMQDLLGVQFVYAAGVLQTSSAAIDFVNASGTYNPTTGRVEITITPSSNATSIQGKPIDDSAQTTSPATFVHLEYDGTEWKAVSDLTIATGSKIDFGGPLSIMRAGEIRFFSGTTDSYVRIPDSGFFKLLLGAAGVESLRYDGDELRFGDVAAAGANQFIGFINIPTTEAGRYIRINGQIISHATLQAGGVILAAGTNSGGGPPGTVTVLVGGEIAKFHKDAGVSNSSTLALRDDVGAGFARVTVQVPTSGAGKTLFLVGGNAAAGSDANGGNSGVQAGLKNGAGTDGDAGIFDTAAVLRAYVRGSDKSVILNAATAGVIAGQVNGTATWTTTSTSQQIASGKFTDYLGEIDVRRAGSTIHGIVSTSTRLQAGVPTSGAFSFAENGTEKFRWQVLSSVNFLYMTDSAVSDATGLGTTIRAQGVTGAGTLITGGTFTTHGGDANLGTATSRVGGDWIARPGNGLTQGTLELRSGAGTTRLKINATGMAFFGVAPVAQPADQVAFTDNTAGTASRTLAALPDPADTPASADALRDDLVANVLPVLRNWAASHADGFNDLRANVIRPLGLTA